MDKAWNHSCLEPTDSRRLQTNQRTATFGEETVTIQFRRLRFSGVHLDLFT